jgi:chaperonin GroES
MAKQVEDYVGDPNIASGLKKKVLDDIAMAVSDGYDIDKKSRSEWEKNSKEAFKLAKLVTKEKNFPFTKAANVMYPLLATASIQFAARAYPNFIKDPDVVKGLVVGDDEDGRKALIASIVGQHMSYQCLQEMEEWEEDTDKGLTILPIVGCFFKKTWFSSGLRRNVSEFRSPEDIVINYKAKSMATAPRITDVLTLYPNELEERKRSGLYLKLDYSTPQSAKDEGDEPATNDPDQPHVFLEQHTWYDLDDDGYKEPYIIVFHKDTKQVARITARFRSEDIQRNGTEIVKITPEQYFTKFSFMPAIDGSIYDRGFGDYLTPINRSINTTLNQIIDSGTWYSSNAGILGKGIQLGKGRGGGVLKFEPNEYKTVGFTGDDIRKNIMPLPAKEPSAVLFSLLGFLVQAGERLSSVTEIMTGDQSNQSERPTTTLARIEQGMKVFSAIHKRLYRAFKSEYKKLFKLNSIYLQPEVMFRIMDTQKTIPREAYNPDSCDIVPVSDPTEITNTQKLIKAQMLVEMKGQGLNDKEIDKRVLEAMQIPEPEKLLDAPPPPPDPKVVIDGEKLQLDKDKFLFEMMKWETEGEERTAKVMKLLAQTEEHIAKAEGVEPGQQIEIYKEHSKRLIEEFKAKHGNKQGSVGSVAGGRSNKGSVQSSAGAS